MIVNTKEMVNEYNELRERQEILNETMDLATTEEDKTSSDYIELQKEIENIKEKTASLISSKDKEDIYNNSDIQTYLDHLEEILETTDKDNVKEIAERQILLIRSSYTFEIFNELTPTMKSETILKQYNSLKRDAEYKLENSEHFTFLSASNIHHYIHGVLNDKLKHKSKLVTGFIYAFIMTASLKPSGHAMFIFFLIRNINSLETQFIEKNALINSINKLAAAL